MAVTASYSTVDDNVVGAKRNRQVAFTFDSSYPLGGEAITPGLVGLVAIDRIIFQGPARSPASTDLAVVCDFDKPNLKLIAFFGDNNNAADAPLIEVAAATDLSTYVVNATVVGY